MSWDGAWLTSMVLLVPLVGRWLSQRSRHRTTADIQRVAEARDALRWAELAALCGFWSTVESILEPVRKSVPLIEADEAVEIRAHLGLIEGELAAGRGEREAAKTAFEGALRRADAIPEESRARELRVAVEAAVELLALQFVAGPIPPLESILSMASEVSSAETLAHLTRLALRRGRWAWERGDWGAARTDLQRAIAIGERAQPPDERAAVFGETREYRVAMSELARADASQAALEIGDILVSLGQRDEGISLLDRSIELLEGASSPAGHAGLAAALASRAGVEITDPVLGDRREATLLERAYQEGRASPRFDGRRIASRAAVRAGMIHGSFGDHAGAADLFQKAHEAVQELTAPGMGVLATHPLLLRGMALAALGDRGGAEDAWRRAFDRGRDDDPEARHLAVVAGCQLHRLRLEAGDLDGAGALLQDIERIVPVVAPAGRRFAAGCAARARGGQRYRAGDRAGAAESLELAHRLADEAGGDVTHDLKIGVLSDLASVAIADGRLEDAETHVRHAFQVPVDRPDDPAARGTRAQLLFDLASVLARQRRFEEALVEATRAFETGRGSGIADGRSAAANAALMIADLSDVPIEERRRLYVAAADLGRLSHTEQGRQVSEAVAARLAALEG